MNAGQSLSLQYHRRKEETLYLVSGGVWLTPRANGEEALNVMRPGDAYLPPGLIHRMEAIVDSDIAEVSTTELEDVQTRRLLLT